MKRLAALTCLAIGLLPAAAVAQTSNAACWLAEQALQEGCNGGGSFGPGGVTEADLTGDGRDDLVIFTGAIACADGSVPMTCGAVYCGADIYVREGDLLVFKGGFLTLCAGLAPGDPPGVALCDDTNQPWTVRWNGTEFVR